MAHSTYGPSGAAKWLACDGAIAVSAGLPDESSTYAQEGTNAHSLGEHCLRSQEEPGAWVGRAFQSTADDAEFTVTQEMSDAVTVYVDHVRRLIEANPGCDVQYERRLGDNSFGGTIDALICTPDRITIVDYKHGQNVFVDVVDNPQLLCYAVLALTLHQPVTTSVQSVEICVVQPRCGGELIRSASYTRAEVYEFYERIEEAMTRGINAAELMESSGPDELQKQGLLTTGPHCRWCRAKAICPQQREEYLQTMGRFEPVDELGDRLAEVLDKADQVREYLKAVESFSRARLERGESVAGWKLVTSQGNRRWTYTGEGLIRRLRKVGIGKREACESRPLSPSQLKKKYPKDAEYLESLCSRPETGTRLAREEDPRPAVNPTPPADVFPDLSFLEI